MSTKIETPEDLAKRLYPTHDEVVRQYAIHAIRARDEQIRAWLDNFSDSIEENEPEHTYIVIDLRDLTHRLESPRRRLPVGPASAGLRGKK